MLPNPFGHFSLRHRFAAVTRAATSEQNSRNYFSHSYSDSIINHRLFLDHVTLSTFFAVVFDTGD